MANINTIVNADRPTVSAVVEKIRSKEYFVDNSFQRKLVWSEKQKVRLIETILIGFPMPEIYFWQLSADANTGQQRSSIVDGQQRLTTITQFVSNEWPLKSKFLDKANQSADFADKSWNDLSAKRKREIWEYTIDSRRIPHSVTEVEVRRIFQRLNETDRSLNPQELRHAEFNGKFITNAERIADLKIWKDWKFFTLAQVRRMQDIELCNSFLVYLRSGISDDTPTALNAIYDLYNDTYKERNNDFNTVKIFLERMDGVFSRTEKVAKLFKSVVHLYALFATTQVARKISNDQLVLKLDKFATEYGKKKSKNKLVEKYRAASAYRTRSKSSREARVGALSEWLFKT